MVRILVTTASKHGATDEIGNAITAALESEGIEAFARGAAEVTTVADVDGVIVGSAVYAGHWLGDAKEFVERFQEDLRRRPVWLFSSGPLGTPPAPDGDPVDVGVMVEKSRARGHRVFAGKLDRDKVGLAERAIVNVVRAPYGDFRDWAEIREWAREIAGTFAVEVHGR